MSSNAMNGITVTWHASGGPAHHRDHEDATSFRIDGQGNLHLIRSTGEVAAVYAESYWVSLRGTKPATGHG